MNADLKLREREESAAKARGIQRFFEISPIHACSYVGFRVAIYEAIFWIVALGISFGFCISDLVTLAGKFGAQTTTVQITLMRNDTLSYPDAAVCFDVYRRTLSSSISAAFVESSFNQSLQIVLQSINNSSGSLIDLSTLPTGDKDVDLVLKSVYLLVAAISDYDLGFPFGAAYDANAWRAVDIVDAFFKQLGYGYAQLNEQVARYMCKQTHGSANGSIQVAGADNMYLDICATAKVNWVGYTMVFEPFDDICFALNTPAYQLFEDSGDIIIFDNLYVSHMSTLVGEWGAETSGWTPELPGYGAPHMSFDMRGWRGFMDPREMDSVAFCADQTGFLVGVEIETQFTAFNHSWGNCGKQQLVDCALFNCLPAARMAADGCWPLGGYTLTAASKPPQTPICGKRYTQAQIKQLGGSYTGTWETCLFNKCTFPPCIAFEYDYDVSLTSFANAGVNATLYQGKLFYAIFEEYVSMDFNAFLAALGGSLGLYLGGSLISIGHIPVYIIFSLLQRPRKRRVVAENGVPVEFALRAVSVMDKNMLAHELVTG